MRSVAMTATPATIADLYGRPRSIGWGARFYAGWLGYGAAFNPTVAIFCEEKPWIQRRHTVEEWPREEG
jgi:hypothetical protein